MSTLLRLCLDHKSYKERVDSRVFFAEAFGFVMGEISEGFSIYLLVENWERKITIFNFFSYFLVAVDIQFYFIALQPSEEFCDRLLREI